MATVAVLRCLGASGRHPPRRLPPPGRARGPPRRRRGGGTRDGGPAGAASPAEVAPARGRGLVRVLAVGPRRRRHRRLGGAPLLAPAAPRRAPRLPARRAAPRLRAGRRPPPRPRPLRRRPGPRRRASWRSPCSRRATRRSASRSPPASAWPCFALWLSALLLVRGLRRFFPRRLPYLYRQGLANLYRPANQTLMVVLALGFGAFLLSTLLLVQHNLLRELRVDRRLCAAERRVLRRAARPAGRRRCAG